MEILYQMIGRASREIISGVIYIFSNRLILNRHRNNLHSSLQSGKVNTEVAELLSESILAIQNLIETSQCRWRQMLNYFGSVPDPAFLCLNCDNCRSKTATVNVTKFAKPILNFLHERPQNRTNLLYILAGSNKDLLKVDSLSVEAAKEMNIIGLFKRCDFY